MTEKRTAVKPPAWGAHWPDDSTDVVEVGKGVPLYEMKHSKKTARAYDVYLNGDHIGTVRSYERRGEAPSGMGARIVRVTGWPTAWEYADSKGRGSRVGSHIDQRNQAVYRLAAQELEYREKDKA